MNPSSHYSRGFMAGGKKVPVGIIIQARMGSTRLPGKVLEEILPGLPMLKLIIKRLKNCRKAHKIIVATTFQPSDEPIVKLAKELKVEVFRGSEDDVLDRYYGAATKYGLKTIVRVTSDCPALEPEMIDFMIGQFLNTHYDYLSNILVRTYPRGMDAEVFSYSALQKAHEEASTKLEREHVTAYIYGNPEFFRLGHFTTFSEDHSQYRLTVDTREDLMVARLVFAELAVKNLVYNKSYPVVIDVLKKLGKLGLDGSKQDKYSSSDYYQRFQKLKSVDFKDDLVPDNLE